MSIKELNEKIQTRNEVLKRLIEFLKNNSTQDICEFINSEIKINDIDLKFIENELKYLEGEIK